MNLFKVKNKTFDLTKKPVIMGILNLTPDSFSDGAKYADVDLALKHVEEMIKDGADIIDIGGESTRPGATRVNTKEELIRILEIVVKVIDNFDIPVSIDTYKGDVAEVCLEAGVHMINDIYSLRNSPEIAKYCATFEAGLCLMHMRGTPDTMQKNTHYDNVVEDVFSFLQERVDFAVENGVSKEYICVDPGIGFGKSIEGNLELIKSNKRLLDTGCSVLMGVSRKSFIGKILNKEVDERVLGTISANVAALAEGARIFRVHDIEEHREALDLAFEIYNV